MDVTVFVLEQQRDNTYRQMYYAGKLLAAECLGACIEHKAYGGLYFI